MSKHPLDEFTPLLFSPSLSSPETPQRGDSSPLHLPPPSSPPYNFWLTHRRLRRDPLQEEHAFEKSSPSSPSSPSFSLPSFRKRIAMVIFAVVSCFLLSGVIFGWAAVQQMLIDDGVYAYLCRPPPRFPFVSFSHVDSNSTENEPQEPQQPQEDKKQGCPEQLVRFNLIYVLSSTLFSCALLPLGPFLDHFGPRAASTVGTSSVFCGFMLVAMSSEEFDGFMGGFVCIAVGGYTILLSSFHLGFFFLLSFFFFLFPFASLPLFFSLFLAFPFSTPPPQATSSPPTEEQSSPSSTSPSTLPPLSSSFFLSSSPPLLSPTMVSFSSIPPSLPSPSFWEPFFGLLSPLPLLLPPLPLPPKMKMGMKMKL